jgi:acyl-coenzyme A synthetase/AMP-(fatty) acid ligase
MDRKATTLVIMLAIAFAGAALAAVVEGLGREELKRQNAELDSRLQQMQQQLEAAKSSEQALRAEMDKKAEQAAREAEQVTTLKESIDEIRNPPEDKPTCFDSDAKYGADANYIRGHVQVGNGMSADHCRLGQLVEFYCIENPPGSGRFLSDAKIMDCPKGSRCVSGECLR